MAENPKNPHNLQDYKPETPPAATEPGFWAGVRERVTRALTGADQLGEQAATQPVKPKHDGVLRWADTGEPYFPQQEKPATTLKPYVPQAAPVGPAPDIQDLPVLTIRAAQPEAAPQATQPVVPAPELSTYQIRSGDTLGGIAEKQAQLRAASGLEGQSSVWAVAIATAKLNGMQTISDVIRAGDTLQLPTADMVRETVQALSQSVAADGKITWSEARAVESQHLATVPANPQVVSR